MADAVATKTGTFDDLATNEAVKHYYVAEAAGQLDKVDPEVRSNLSVHIDRLRTAGLLPPPGMDNWDKFASAVGEGQTFNVAVPPSATSTTTTPVSDPTQGQLTSNPIPRNLGGLAGMTAGAAAGARLGRMIPVPFAPLVLSVLGAGAGAAGLGGAGEALSPTPPNAPAQPLPQRVLGAAEQQGQLGAAGEAGGRALGLTGAGLGKIVEMMPTAAKERAALALRKVAEPVTKMLRDSGFLDRMEEASLPPRSQAPSGRFVPTALGMAPQARRLGAVFKPDKVAKALNRDTDFARVLYDVAQPAEKAAIEAVGDAQTRLDRWKGVEKVLAGRMAGILETGALLHGNIGAAIGIAAPAGVNWLLSSKPAQALAAEAISQGTEQGAGQAAFAQLARLWASHQQEQKQSQMQQNHAAGLGPTTGLPLGQLP